MEEGKWKDKCKVIEEKEVGKDRGETEVKKKKEDWSDEKDKGM